MAQSVRPSAIWWHNRLNSLFVSPPVEQRNPIEPFFEPTQPAMAAEKSLLQCLFGHKFVVLLCITVGLGLGYLYFLRQPPVYQSTARILVMKEEVSQLPVQGVARAATGAYEDTLATQMLLIKSPLIVAEASKKRPLRSLQMFSGIQDPAPIITAGLEARSASAIVGEKSSVMDLYFKGSVSHECQTVLDAVIQSYEDFLQESHHNVSKETVDLITQAKETLLKDLERKELAYQEFREDAPLMTTKDGAMNLHRTRLSSIEAARSELLISRSQTKAQLQSLEAAIARGGNREALMLLADKSARGDSGSNGKAGLLMKDLFPLLLEEQMLLEDHGADHPKIRAIRKRINLTRNHLRTMGFEEPSDDPENPSANKKAQPLDFIIVYLESLREDLKAIDEKQRELDELFASESDQAKNLSAFEVKDETLRHDISRTRQLFEGVVKRLEEINLIQGYGKLKPRVIHGAGPGVQVAPVMWQVMGISLTLSIMVGCGLAYLLELADKRFRSPEELIETIGFPIIGHIPYIAPYGPEHSASILDSSLCVFHRPSAVFSEAYRGIRTALYFSTRGEGHRVIQVSSPNPGDGKSTMAANLAIAIAQSGKQTLLVDCDLRRPRVHKLLGLSRDIGVTSVIAGDCDLADAIQETEVENLSALTCGLKPANPSEILSSQRFSELLSILRDKFDYVIVDTPPIMAVTDPAVVAPRVDGLLLTVRIGNRSRQDCVRTAEILNNVAANVVGIIVNGVDHKDRYGYGYAGKYTSSEGPGLGYKGYGSGFSYGNPYDDRYAAYYAEDDEDETDLVATPPRKRIGNSVPPPASA